MIQQALPSLPIAVSFLFHINRRNYRKENVKNLISKEFDLTVQFNIEVVSVAQPSNETFTSASFLYSVTFQTALNFLAAWRNSKKWELCSIPGCKSSALSGKKL